MKKVTNISQTLRVLYDKRGKKISLEPNESAEMVHPPYGHSAFNIEELEKKEKKKNKKEVK